MTLSASVWELMLSLKLASHLNHPVNLKPPMTWYHSRTTTSDPQEEKAWWVLVVACWVSVFVSWLGFVLRTSGNPKTHPRLRTTVLGSKHCKYPRKKIYSSQSLHLLFSCTLKKTLCSLWRVSECGYVIINKMAYLCSIHPRYLLISFIINSSPEM